MFKTLRAEDISCSYIFQGYFLKLFKKEIGDFEEMNKHV